MLCQFCSKYCTIFVPNWLCSLISSWACWCSMTFKTIHSSGINLRLAWVLTTARSSMQHNHRTTLFQMTCICCLCQIDLKCTCVHETMTNSYLWAHIQTRCFKNYEQCVHFKFFFFTLWLQLCPVNSVCQFFFTDFLNEVLILNLVFRGKDTTGD